MRKETTMFGPINRIVLIILGMVLAASSGRAEVGGKITGVVKDQSGAVIAGATVVAINTATAVQQTTNTDQQGSYAFPVLPVGQYEIDVTADGFKPNKTNGLAININAGLPVDLTLRVRDQ